MSIQTIIELEPEFVDWITIEEFEELVNSFIQKKTEKFQAKALITKETVNDAIQVLLNKQSQIRTPSFRFWARKRFTLKTQGDQYILCSKDEDEDIGRPVCVKEELYRVLTQAHMSCDHKGRDPTYDYVKKSYSYVPKEICDMLVKKCKRCAIKRKQKIPSPTTSSPPSAANSSMIEKPLLTHSFMSCLQMNLIDYSNKPSCGKSFILYIQDNHSKYIWAYALKEYIPSKMAKKLNKVFCQFGTPLILQTDCQYVDVISNLLVEYWPGLKLIHAKSKDSNSYNISKFEALLFDWTKENKEWSTGIDKACYQYNTTVHYETGKIPYEVVFGRILRNDESIWNKLLQSGIQMNHHVVHQDELTKENQKMLFNE